MTREIKEIITVTSQGFEKTQNSDLDFVNMDQVIELWTETIDQYRVRLMVPPFNIAVILRKSAGMMGSMDLVKDIPEFLTKTTRYKGVNISINPEKISQPTKDLKDATQTTKDLTTIEANFTFLHEWQHFLKKIVENYQIPPWDTSAYRQEETECDQFAKDHLTTTLTEGRPTILRFREGLQLPFNATSEA